MGFPRALIRKVFEFMELDDLAYVALNPNLIMDAEEFRLGKVEIARMAPRDVEKRWESGRS